jgi:CDP-glycerol glycerophosphotransferase (TagB/SpsB family)
MKHADVVVQSRGSLALDAIAFDTPVVSIGYDGGLPRGEEDSFLLENLYEHYLPLVKARGIWLVGSHETLAQAIDTYLKDPSTHADGRAQIRRDHLEPLDGGASRRLIDCLATTATHARARTLAPGDWHLMGLGDLTWSSRQGCNLDEFLSR